MHTLTSFLQDNFDALIDAWKASVAQSWQGRQDLVADGALEKQCANLLQEIINVLPGFNPKDGSWDSPHSSELVSLLQDVGSLWAHKGLRTSETSTFIVSLKYLVSDRIQETFGQSEATTVELMTCSDRLMDRLLITSHEAYLVGREKLIQQQSHALLELSSPVVKMWDRMLLLPLIGVIDTKRARQITEALLSEIAKQEALVTVIDLTGVPVFDTAVAGHLMKTIKASQMLGCQVIMTGISPEGAMVLTKLGIDFRDVITRGNLHSGVSEGFRRLGMRVSTMEHSDHAA